MKTIGKFVSLFLLIFVLFNTAHAVAEANSCDNRETVFYEYKVVGNKLYIQPDQLCITNAGIFIFIQGEQILVRQLNCDDNDIYCLTEHLDTITDKCKNGHQIWCTRCWGCVVRECVFHCICVEWNE